MVTVIPGVYSFEWVGYQGHVIPIVIACAILAFLEKRLHKIVPEMFDLFVTPLVSVFVTVLVTLIAVGPVFVWAENAVLGLIQALLTLPFGIGSFIVGLFYAPTVVTGIHQMYTAIDLGQLAQYGVTYWLPIASAANIAQGGAALAVAFKTHDAKIKGLALPSALSAFMGITEPAIFGVNLRFFKPFIAGCIGGGCGALGLRAHLARRFRYGRYGYLRYPAVPGPARAVRDHVCGRRAGFLWRLVCPVQGRAQGFRAGLRAFD